jgi:hypothetical protein
VLKKATRQGNLSGRTTDADGSLRDIRWWPSTICVAIVAIALSATVLTVIAFAEISNDPPVAASSGKGDLLRRPETPNEPYAVVVTRGNGITVLRRLR